MANITHSDWLARSETSLRDYAAGLVSAFARYRAERRTAAELSALTDRELNDLGLSRGDISRIAREAAQQAH